MDVIHAEEGEKDEALLGSVVVEESSGGSHRKYLPN